MSKRVKELMVSELVGELQDTDSCVVVGLGALDVETTSAIRGSLRAEGIRLRVLKNRVAAHALGELGWDGVPELLDGPSALVFGEGGALVASKCLVDWEKKVRKAITIRGGLLDGRVLDEDDVRRLATIPDKPTLYSMLAAVVVAPVGQIAGLLNEMLAGVGRAVGAVAEKLGGDEPVAEQPGPDE